MRINVHAHGQVYKKEWSVEEKMNTLSILLTEEQVNLIKQCQVINRRPVVHRARSNC